MKATKRGTRQTAKAKRQLTPIKAATNGKKSAETRRFEALTFSKELGRRYVRGVLEGMDNVAERHWIHTQLAVSASWPEYADPSLGTPRLHLTMDLGGVIESERSKHPTFRIVTVRVGTERGGPEGKIELADYQLPGFIRALAGLLAKGKAEGVFPGLALTEGASPA